MVLMCTVSLQERNLAWCFLVFFWLRNMWDSHFLKYFKSVALLCWGVGFQIFILSLEYSYISMLLVNYTSIKKSQISSPRAASTDILIYVTSILTIKQRRLSLHLAFIYFKIRDSSPTLLLNHVPVPRVIM